jgi:hypothetical protein
MTMPSVRVRTTATVVPLLAVLAVAGCGYTMGFDEPTGGVRTIAVAVVDNRTFRQRIEIPLTRAIHEAIPIYSGLRLASHSTADRILSAELQDIRGRNLVPGSPPVREGALDFAVLVRLTERTTGTVLVEREIIDRAEFRSTIGENQTSAQAEAVSDLARKIVLALEGKF